jgi:hypothetical protein
MSKAISRASFQRGSTTHFGTLLPEPIQTAPQPANHCLGLLVGNGFTDLFFWDSGDFSSVQSPQPHKASGPCAIRGVSHLLATHNGARQERHTLDKGRITTLLRPGL